MTDPQRIYRDDPFTYYLAADTGYAVDVPNELASRYRNVLPVWDQIQDELEALFEQAEDADTA